MAVNNVQYLSKCSPMPDPIASPIGLNLLICKNRSRDLKIMKVLVLDVYNEMMLTDLIPEAVGSYS